MNKKIYFYSKKYPEYDITELVVNSEEYIIGKGYKQLCGIYTNYDISCLTPCDDERYISLYSPYEDEHIYVYENTIAIEYIFSFNKKLINKWRNKDIQIIKHRLEERLQALKEAEK